jgi:hypothetical protein
MISAEIERNGYRLIADVHPIPAVLTAEWGDERTVPLLAGHLFFVAHECISRVGLVAVKISVDLTVILVGFQLWRRSATFNRGAYVANVLIMAGGFVLLGYQMAGLFNCVGIGCM